MAATGLVIKDHRPEPRSRVLSRLHDCVPERTLRSSTRIRAAGISSRSVVSPDDHGLIRVFVRPGVDLDVEKLPPSLPFVQRLDLTFDRAVTFFVPFIISTP